MRTLPLLFGFVVGVVLAWFPSCSPATCSAASCPLGCCDASGKCQSASNSTCGKSGSACTVCSVSDSCVMGTCQGGNTGAGTSGGGGAGAGSTGGGTAGDYSAFLTTFSNAYCQKAIDCGQLPTGASADCRLFLRELFATYGLDFSGSISELSVSKGTATFDATMSAACLAAINALTCPSGSPDLTACRAMLHPNAAPNASCYGSGDCTDSSTSCNGASCARHCTAGGSLGERCRVDGTCSAPFFCGTGGLCRNDPPVGTPCQMFSSECGPRMSCTNSMCTPLPANGQPCPSFVCAPGNYCDTQRVCRTKKTSGATCGMNAECEDSLRCFGQQCGPKVAAGQPCVVASDCQAGLTCDGTSRCSPVVMAGGACRSFSDCATGLACDDVSRTCRLSTSVASGQPCSSTRFCSAFDECRGKVVVTDGGMNTAGICGSPMVGDPCTSHFSCGVSQFCSSTTNGTCVSADGGTPCSTTSNCVAGSYCANMSTCAVKAAAGQICDGNKSDSCAAPGETCQPFGTAGQFRCQTLPAIGQPCIGGKCAPFGVCVQGMCAAAGRVGQPCVENFPTACLTGECLLPDGGVRGLQGTGGTCQAPRANGSTCTGNGGCQSGFCDRLFLSFSAATGVCAPACN